MSAASSATYDVNCWKCHARFDAVAAAWCECVTTDRTFVCPHCGECFCRAPLPSRHALWQNAPKALWDRKAALRATGTTANVRPDTVKRPLVLVAEDDAALRAHVERLIHNLGYGVVCARNGEEALDLARTYQPEVVLTDAFMPKLDGRELCRRIGTGEEFGQPKMIVMTSLYTRAQHKYEALRDFHVDEYLTKPVDAEALTTVLRKHLG